MIMIIMGDWNGIAGEGADGSEGGQFGLVEGKR